MPASVQAHGGPRTAEGWTAPIRQEGEDPEKTKSQSPGRWGCRTRAFSTEEQHPFGHTHLCHPWVARGSSLAEVSERTVLCSCHLLPLVGGSPSNPLPRKGEGTPQGSQPV